MSKPPDAMPSSSDGASPVDPRSELLELRRQLQEAEQRAAELRQSRRQLHRFIRQTLTEHEEERHRFSRILHDEAGQVLTALKLSLEMAIEDLALVDGLAPADQAALELIGQELQQAKGLGEETAGHIQEVMHLLYPSALSDLGLNLALEGLCQDFADTGHLAVTYAYEGAARPLIHVRVKISLYRILEEVLGNASQHPQVRRAAVVLRAGSRLLTLIIDLAGRRDALSPQDVIAIRSRLLGLDGRLEQEIGTNQELRLSIRVPLPGQQKNG